MADTVSSDSVAQDQLRAFIERIERLEDEKKAISDDIREVKAEAKANGFSIPVLNEIIKIRKKDHNDRMEFEALLELYLGALGMAVAPPHDDDDYTPPRRDERPEYRADMTGLRQIGSVASGIVANLNTNPAPADSNSQAERQPNPEPHSMAAADIQPETANEAPMEVDGDSAEVATAPLSESVDILPGGVQLGKDGRVDASPADSHPVANVGEEANGAIAAASVDPASREVDDADRQQLAASGFTGDGEAASADLPTNHPGGDHANSDGKAVASHASGKIDGSSGAQAVDIGADVRNGRIGDQQPAERSGEDETDRAADEAQHERLVIQDASSSTPSLIGSAADKSGEAGGISPSASPAPTKLKMNAEFFDEPHPLCRNPDGPRGCGGNSKLGLCVECRAAAAHKGPTFQPEAAVH